VLNPEAAEALHSFLGFADVLAAAAAQGRGSGGGGGGSGKA
jgi:hypothetical protein